jgi:nucleotide-binding universal stress UspA family protein
LGFVEALCREAGVQCEPLSTSSNSPYEAIVEAAAQSGADLIFMASHGRKGIRAKILGSETLRTLTHSAIPVLVYSYGARET